MNINCSVKNNFQNTPILHVWVPDMTYNINYGSWSQILVRRFYFSNNINLYFLKSY